VRERKIKKLDRKLQKQLGLQRHMSKTIGGASAIQNVSLHSELVRIVLPLRWVSNRDYIEMRACECNCPLLLGLLAFRLLLLRVSNDDVASSFDRLNHLICQRTVLATILFEGLSHMLLCEALLWHLFFVMLCFYKIKISFL